MRRPPKPRIVKPHLKWVWRARPGTWAPLHRVTWLQDGKRRERTITLDWRGDARELDRLYWECEAGRHARQAAPARYTWGQLVTAWRGDPRVQRGLAYSTKRSYARPMERLLEKNAGKDVRKATRQTVRQLHDAMAGTPREADRLLQTISLLWNYGKRQLDWPLGDNPAEGIRHFGRQREFEPWPDWMIRALETAPVNVRTAAELMLGTGQRPSAAITMRFDQFRGEWMTVTDEKGGVAFEVYCPARLRAFVEALPRRGAHLLAKNLAEPLGYGSIERAFRKWRTGLGARAQPYTLHGLRKLSIIQLAESGATDAEIQAITNQSLETIAYYRRRASRKRLSRSAQERRK